MRITIEQAKERLANKEPIWVYFQIDGISDEQYYRRCGADGHYAWAMVQDHLMVFCHGYKKEGLISLANDKPARVEVLVQKLARHAKYHGNKIFLDCCYGANKGDTIDGIEIIPTNCSYHISSDVGWYCQDMAEFEEFVSKVVNTFSGTLMIFPCSYISEEQDKGWYHTNVAQIVMGIDYPYERIF